MFLIRIALILLFTCQIAQAKHLYNEKYYQNIWCEKQNGITEFKLIDDTRVDCLTKTHAVEFDFAPKWAEAIGQSLHYARLTGKNPAIVLIIEKNSDFKYYNKIKPLCEQYQISLSYMQQPQEPLKKKVEYYEANDIIEIIIKLIKQLLALFADF